ncbi:hypothetical protein MKX01_023530 [Papaver californicum]|nr:hypothetical protein MKX01_023530 [Papaver californicum]
MARDKTLVQNLDDEEEFLEAEEYETHGRSRASSGGRGGKSMSSSSKKQRRSIFIDDVAEEADDEEEDYGKSRKKRKPMSERLAKKSIKENIRPSPHLMNLDAARKLDIPVESRRERGTGISFDVIGGKMFNDGFLYKTVSKKSIEYQNIQPSLDELEKICEPGHGVGGNLST